MTAVAEAYRRAFARGLEPEPELTVSQWADLNRVLTSRSSSKTGPWKTSRFPFIREIMDELSASSPTERLVVEAGRQVAKTESGLNWIGYVIHHAPGPMLIVEPTVDMAKKFSKQRLTPMIEECPSLLERIRPSRSRDSGNTMFVKEFDGGILMLAGANSSAALRGMPVRFLFCEELDTWEDQDGDALAIAQSCTNNFPNRKIALFGNPTVLGASRIHDEYLRGDQRRYFIPCPRCGHRDFLTWQGFADHVQRKEGGHHRIAFSRDEENGRVLEAWMVCSACEGRVDEHEKKAMFEAGEWRSTAPGDGITKSYHLSSLYSPFGFKTWYACAIEFVAAKGDPSKLRAFVNEVLGEAWEERSEKIEPHAIVSRRERWEAEVPVGVGVIVAGADVQIDRIELCWWGYGEAEEAWILQMDTLRGDPAQPQVWAALDRALLRTFRHESGRMMPIEAACIDTGGRHTEQAYQFCVTRWARRVFAVKGDGHLRGVPIVGRPSTNNRYRCPLFLLCVDTAKATIMSRLRLPRPGPAEPRAGFIHIPEWYDEDLASQLTAEVPVLKYHGGKVIRTWQERKSGSPNEQLDMAVYALSALHILDGMERGMIKQLGELAQTWAAPPAGPPPPAPEPEGMKVPSALVRPRSRGWVNSWRR